MSLLNAREVCMDAKRAVRERRSTALEKQREKSHYKDALCFAEWSDHWLQEAIMADNVNWHAKVTHLDGALAFEP